MNEKINWEVVIAEIIFELQNRTEAKEIAARHEAKVEKHDVKNLFKAIGEYSAHVEIHKFIVHKVDKILHPEKYQNHDVGTNG